MKIFKIIDTGLFYIPETMLNAQIILFNPYNHKSYLLLLLPLLGWEYCDINLGYRPNPNNTMIYSKGSIQALV